MKLKKNGKSVNHVFRAAAMVPTAVLSIGLTVPTPAAHATIAQPEEIIVTARRTEEVIQNVPISMTVFNQDMLNERNVTNGADLVAYTPSLSVNNRFGSDQATFAIRGFTQELRTTASVAVYFADVVAPRAGGSVSAGDGAGPGSFFDLQNVQVLKGPQGTLFGRNTTGGAIQLVPQEPTSKLEGYYEESLGNYNMHRHQGVVNVPISDMARARVGFDSQKRDGYLTNYSGVGPNHFSNVNYITGRASLMLDLSDAVQNYTILSYTDSRNNGSMQGLFALNPNNPGYAFLLQPNLGPTLAQQKGDFYGVSNDAADPISKLVQYQLINATTWTVNDDLTIKNNLSYANLNQTTASSVMGTDWIDANNRHFQLFAAGKYPGLPTNAQKTIVEELQFSGNGLDRKLAWQSGLYFEDSKPDGWSGSLSPAFASCTGLNSTDTSQWQCGFPLALVGQGVVQANLGKTEFKNIAAYSQGTYDITDEFRVTLGLRYTVDKTIVTGDETAWLPVTTNPGAVPAFPASANGAGIAGPYLAASAPTLLPQGSCVVSGLTAPDCKQHISQRSEAPTWLIDFDYLPTPDMMVYAKYARGYRQGSINYAAPEGYQAFGPEKVDAYEIGTKTSFHSFVSGTFNVAAFYNELADQQIQLGLSATRATSTTAIVNAGSSTIQGLEVETTLSLTKDLTAMLSYTYLDTKIVSLVYPDFAPLTALGYTAVPSAVEGSSLTFSPHNAGTLGLNYRLPFPTEIGDVSVGASYSYTGSQKATEGTLGELEPRKLVNMNVNWKAIFGSGFDASAYVTNLTQQKYTQYVSGLYDSFGMDARVVGEPRMAGVRLKYNFQ